MPCSGPVPLSGLRLPEEAAAAHGNLAWAARRDAGMKRGITATERGADVSGVQHVSAGSPSLVHAGRRGGLRAGGRCWGHGLRLPGAQSEWPKSAQIHPLITSKKDAVSAQCLEKNRSYLLDIQN